MNRWCRGRWPRPDPRNSRLLYCFASGSRQGTHVIFMRLRGIFRVFAFSMQRIFSDGRRQHAALAVNDGNRTLSVPKSTPATTDILCTPSTCSGKWCAARSTILCRSTLRSSRLKALPAIANNGKGHERKSGAYRNPVSSVAGALDLFGEKTMPAHQPPSGRSCQYMSQPR